MSTVVGIVTVIVGSITWFGQGLAFFAPATAVKMGLLEPEEEIDSTLYVVEAHAMGLSDLLTAWALPASALLMLVSHPAWPYLALVGSGVYIYFAGVTTLSRVYLKRQGKKVGRATSERAAYLFGLIWVTCSLAMIALATAELSS